MKIPAFLAACCVTAQALYAVDAPAPISLELYYAPYCHHSQRIIDYLNKENIKLHLVNVSNDEAAKKFLGEKGGRMIVPCLFIDGQPLYNDDEIIQWLQSNRERLDLSTPGKT